MENNQEILLESGINEVEIMEFYLGQQSFGLNVAKIRQIVRFEESMRTALPEADPAALGVVMVRGETFPLIDLGKALKRTISVIDEDSDKKLVLITEFNNKVTGFLISGVNRIHRVSWDALQPMHYFAAQNLSVNFTGSINIENNEILVIDIERVLGAIDKEIEFDDVEDAIKTVTSREDIKLLFAEDSNYIRETMVEHFHKAGLNKLQVFENGGDAFKYLENLNKESKGNKKSLRHELDVIVTDIEMPQMDGLTLCNRFKKEIAQDIPVIIYSSLINEQMILKCQEVHANAYVAKPKVLELLDLIDKHCVVE